MNATIKLWLDYLGGPDLLWLIFICIAGTQLVKMLFAAFGRPLKSLECRPVPYLLGAAGGLALLGFESRAAMVGMACGMLSSLLFFTTMSWLERDAAPDWQKSIARKAQIK